MNVSIRSGKAAGTVCAPPSKSFAHRMLICAALSQGTSVIEGISQSEDVLATLDCISALGAKYSISGDTLTVQGTGGVFPSSAEFPCRESGSSLRFFMPIALVGGGSYKFRGTPRLMERSVSVYEDIFSKRDISVSKTSQMIEVSGKLIPGEYELPGDVSSQFVTGLLFALPLLPEDSVIKVLPPVESRAYIDITISVLKTFGVEVEEKEENLFFIRGSQVYKETSLSVEGDWSNAAALFAFDRIGGDVTVEGLNFDSVQGDRICLEYLDILSDTSDKEKVLDLSGCPDLGPVLFAVAAAKGGATFTGTRRLRIKESDRAQAMALELEKFGIKAEVYDNKVVIEPGVLKTPTEVLHGHNDHRIVMAMSLLASLTGGEIDEAESINKSYPEFFGVIRKLGLEIEYGL